MANGDGGVGGQIVGWLMGAAGTVAGAASGWALWSLRRWTQDEIRKAIERYDEERQKHLDKVMDDRRRYVDRQLRELKGEVAESADQLETKFAHTVAALEQRYREHDQQLRNGGERFMKMETNYQHMSRDFYNFRQRFEGGQVKVWRRSPAQEDEDGG